MHNMENMHCFVYQKYESFNKRLLIVNLLFECIKLYIDG